MRQRNGAVLKQVLRKKAIKLEKAIERIIQKHREIDDIEEKNNIIETDRKYIATLEKQVKKIREWTNKNDDRTGSSGKPVKSNITDNESAKMKTSKGMVQEYQKESPVVVGFLFNNLGKSSLIFRYLTV